MLELIDHGTIREIRLARPPVNALNPELVEHLTLSLHDAYTECEAVVLSGQKGIFCAGLDIVELVQVERKRMRVFWEAFFRLLETIACSPIPVATAITGHAPAGGMVVNLMVDYRVMARGRYKIGLNETQVGLVIPPLLQDSFRRLVGTRAMESMVVSGALIEPEQALETGLVDALEDSYEATIQNALGWCKDMLALPRQAMLGNRAIARAHFKKDFAGYTGEGVETFVDTWFSDEAQQVMRALIARLKGKN